jgi:hypothetical protein
MMFPMVGAFQDCKISDSIMQIGMIKQEIIERPTAKRRLAGNVVEVYEIVGNWPGAAGLSTSVAYKIPRMMKIMKVQRLKRIGRDRKGISSFE